MDKKIITTGLLSWVKGLFTINLCYVEKTHEDVGDKFAEEARAIHDGEKPDRGIRGKASKEQVDALLDDGIEIMPLPDIKLDG